MDRIVPPLQREWRVIRDMPLIVFLRKLEFLFYFLFLALATTFIALPLVTNLKMIPLFIVGGISIIYAIGIYFLRLKMYVHFGLMLHTGVFLIFASTGFLETGFSKAGIIMIVLGILSIAIIFVFASLGRKVIVRNSGVGQQLNQPRLGVDLLNHPLQDDQANNVILHNGPVNHPNPGLPNGHVHHPDIILVNAPVNHPDIILANAPVNHPDPVLANGPVNHPDPVLANGPVNHPDPILANDPVDLPNLGNGQVVQQPRDEPEDQVVQQPRDEPEDQAVQPREEVN